MIRTVRPLPMTLLGWNNAKEWERFKLVVDVEAETVTVKIVEAISIVESKLHFMEVIRVVEETNYVLGEN